MIIKSHVTVIHQKQNITGIYKFGNMSESWKGNKFY